MRRVLFVILVRDGAPARIKKSGTGEFQPVPDGMSRVVSRGQIELTQNDNKQPTQVTCCGASLNESVQTSPRDPSGDCLQPNGAHSQSCVILGLKIVCHMILTRKRLFDPVTLLQFGY